jgi:hypothetical protein
METPLLSRDGFPRADIDVAQSEITGRGRYSSLALSNHAR